MDTKPFLWNNYPDHKYPSPGICSPTSAAPDTVCAPVTPHQVRDREGNISNSLT